ncbi:hypothetical protein [Natranaerobius trueperi]|uniref:Uncharacterized protein n=1 Tax=Natranaerobius trueperi TaxID=759412 RepID=A0A226BUY8_9FIRM|nr:hypothetical protein [Natranaerobius trueperi]OWZ82691.1 hypothetical protein CDO51_12750 [Natranaerobius trueperi]
MEWFFILNLLKEINYIGLYLAILAGTFNSIILVLTSNIYQKKSKKYLLIDLIKSSFMLSMIKILIILMPINNDIIYGGFFGTIFYNFIFGLNQLIKYKTKSLKIYKINNKKLNRRFYFLNISMITLVFLVEYIIFFDLFLLGNVVGILGVFYATIIFDLTERLKKININNMINIFLILIITAIIIFVSTLTSSIINFISPIDRMIMNFDLYGVFWGLIVYTFVFEIPKIIKNHHGLKVNCFFNSENQTSKDFIGHIINSLIFASIYIIKFILFTNHFYLFTSLTLFTISLIFLIKGIMNNQQA